MKPLQLAELLRKYEEKWVALNKARTKVIACGRSLEEALSLAKNQSSETPILTYVPRFDLDYVGWMKFPYQEYPRDPSEAFPDSKIRLVPMIPVEIIVGDKSIPLDALADSGANNCIFPGMLGVALGIDVHRGPKQLISGLGGRVIEARFHQVKLKVGFSINEIYAGFSFDTIGITGLLGQKGFFENFRVIFNRSENCIIVNKITIIEKFLTELGF